MKKKILIFLAVAMICAMIAPLTAFAYPRNSITMNIPGEGDKAYTDDDQKECYDYWAQLMQYSSQYSDQTYWWRVRTADGNLSAATNADSFSSSDYSNDVLQTTDYRSGYVSGGGDYLVAMQCESSDTRDSDFDGSWQPDQN